LIFTISPEILISLGLSPGFLESIDVIGGGDKYDIIKLNSRAHLPTG
jgi:hypothetical protein